MSAHTNFDQTYLPQIKQHARDRWHERTPVDRSIEEAWFIAIPVEAPEADYDHARLYKPTNILLIVRDEWLRTVLNNDGRIQAPRCDNCDELVESVTSSRCSSCGEPQSLVQTPGRPTITRDGENR